MRMGLLCGSACVQQQLEVVDTRTCVWRASFCIDHEYRMRVCESAWLCFSRLLLLGQQRLSSSSCLTLCGLLCLSCRAVTTCKPYTIRLQYVSASYIRFAGIISVAGRL